MWRKFAWSIAFAVSSCPPGNSSGQDQPTPGNLVAHCNWGRLDVISGRMTLSRTRLGRRSTVTSGDPETGVRETLSFSSESLDAAWLHYEYADGKQCLLVDVQRSKQVVIERLPQPGSQLAVIRYRQPERGKITLAIECQERSYQIVGDSFWHLTLTDPEAFRDHFVPVLQSLRPDWRLECTARRVEGALLDVARQGQLPDTKRMERLVTQLRHPEFLFRQAADRQLRELGQSSLAYLDGLNERTLNVEQRTRIRHIRKALKVDDSDTPARVAAWLAGDVGAWVALLDREEEKKRTVAARHLATISRRPIAFDPLAGEIERRSQIGRLRANLGLDRPVLISGGNDTTRLR